MWGRSAQGCRDRPSRRLFEHRWMRSRHRGDASGFVGGAREKGARRLALVLVGAQLSFAILRRWEEGVQQEPGGAGQGGPGRPPHR